MPTIDHLARAAERAARRPGFVAHALSAEQAMAALGCDRETAEWLRLCRLPKRGQWAAGVAQLAAGTGVDAGALGELLRGARA